MAFETDKVNLLSQRFSLIAILEGIRDENENRAKWIGRQAHPGIQQSIPMSAILLSFFLRAFLNMTAAEGPTRSSASD